MSPVDQAMVDRVLEREGGYVDNPLDKGGPTNKGITLKTLEAHLGHPPSLAELRDLTTVTARDIYFHTYMVEPGFMTLHSDSIRELLFDAAVNSGPVNAVKMLQRSLNTTLHVKLEVDGVLGAKTIEAMQGQLIQSMVYRLLAQRLRFYSNIIRVNPRQAEFAGGWINRVAGIMEDLSA